MRSLVLALLALAGCGRVNFEAVVRADAASDATDGSDAQADATTLFCTAARNAAEPYADGAGTQDDPYRICTAAQLARISERPDDWTAHFRLESSIDAASLSPGPIGSLVDPFSGTFDGAFFEIQNLRFGTSSIGGTPMNERGLFGVVGNRGLIRRLVLRNVAFSGMEQRRTGTLAGLVLPTGGVRQVAVVQSSLLVSADRLWRIGSLIGENQGLVEDCFVNVSLQAMATTENIEERTSVGGLVGANRGTVRNCYFAGELNTNAARVGGVVGRNRVFDISSQAFVPGALSDSFVMEASITGDSSMCHHTGPVIGGGVESTLERLYYDDSINCTNTDAGCASCDYAENQTAVDFAMSPNYFGSAANPPLDMWDFTNTWTISPSGDRPVLRGMN